MQLAPVRKKIEAACRDAGRPPAEVTLVAVTKSLAPEKIREALAAGLRVFGENRVQEAEEKWPALRAEVSDVSLHFIGHLQTNKARAAVALFDAIESVDSERLAAALGEEMAKQGRRLPCFLQVNTGEEPQKGGIAPRELDGLYRFSMEKAGLDVRGLMCVPPEGETPGLHFALLHKLAGTLGLPSLSMGMSADFEAAIRHGATHIRLGSALFGPRAFPSFPSPPTSGGEGQGEGAARLRGS